MMPEPQFTVGQVVVYEHSQGTNRPEAHLSITKVGRTWVHLSNGERFDPTTMHVDGGRYASPGRIWLSEAALKRDRTRRRLYQALRNDLSRALHPDVRISDLQRVRVLLRLPPPK